MEYIDLILKALATGASKAATKAVPDLYNSFKALIKRKLPNQPTTTKLLEQHQQEPKTYEAPLKEKLIEAAVDKDEEIINLAKKLLEQLESKQETGQNNVNNIGGDAKGNLGNFNIERLNQNIS